MPYRSGTMKSWKWYPSNKTSYQKLMSSSFSSKSAYLYQVTTKIDRRLLMDCWAPD